MKSKKQKNSISILKRFLVMVLSVCILGCQLLPGMSIIAYATELNNEDLGNGTSEGTAYAWVGPISGSGDAGGATYRFDLCGLKAEQTGYSSDGIWTTYRQQGYSTYLQIDDGPKYKANGLTNGAVEEPSNMGVELKINVSPSPDNKYVFVDYYVYDKYGQGGGNGRSVKLGTGADVMIGGSESDRTYSDYATVYKNSRGFHMVNQETMETFDCITNDDNLGVTQPTTRWMGHYISWSNKVFIEGGGATLSNTDSAIAYSWHFQLYPYETVHKRIAFAIRDSSYYVSETGHDNNQANGTYSNPFKTIEYAVNKIGNKKGYIYVMDYPDIVNPITISGTTSKDITIASTDYDRFGNPTNGNSDYIKTLKRAGTYTGPLFNVSNATLKFTDINLDGNNVESPFPLISATSGTVEINSGTVVKNCNGMSGDTGSAIAITGEANLSMNFGTVENNISNGKGAVYFDSNGDFFVKNLVTIKDNLNSTGGKNNTYLAQGKKISVDGDLDASLIGVTTQQIPEVSLGDSSEAGEEVVIAVPSEDYPTGLTSCPFADNFLADAEDGTGIFVAVGSSELANLRNTVLKRNGYSISFVYQDSVTGGIITAAPDTPSLLFAAGDAVSIPTAPSIAGYELTGVSISPETDTLGATLEEGIVNITGTMPGTDVVVTYEYTPVSASIAFVVNGGTPQPPTLTGTAGESVNALLPNVTRYGYIFNGWSSVNNQTEPNYINALPSTYPQEPITYYAIWEPDPNVKFDYTVEYTNRDGTITFQSTTSEGDYGYSVETPIQSQRKNIHGYVWNLADSLINPAQYHYNGQTAAPVGNFDGAGNFTGTMPGQDVAVRYAYRVNQTDLSARSNLKIRCETSSGTLLSESDPTAYFPETAINAGPPSIYGYQYVSGSITEGHIADDADGHLVNAVQGTFDENGDFTGTMPNQDVTITYIYEATGEGYDFDVDYLDNDTSDPNLRNIINLETQKKTADSAVNADYQDLYGYSYGSAGTEPSSIGNFDSSHNYTAAMPAEDLTVTYRYNRVPAQWAVLTYKSGTHGTITHGSGVSPDVQEQGIGTGIYRASVLRNDGTAEGQADSYTWSTIKEKRLVPKTQADQYYRFAGWFLDQNENGIMDNGEQLLAEDHRFTGDETVTALFEEDPEKWIDLQFAAGEHGSLTGTNNTALHIQYDKTWGDITSQIPGYVPEINYLPDGWYDGDLEVAGADVLKNGHTYTIRFYGDPAIFGTDVAMPDASAGINGEGKGKITVYHTTAGYKYIITNLDGKIAGVETGNIAGRVYFDGVYPCARYLVYEAAGNVNAVIGNQIADTSGNISEPLEVLTPVVETNYQILFDENHEGRTVLVIKPADKQSDYGVLNSDGTVVVTEETGSDGWQEVTGNPGSVIFSGLNYNEEYIVVARPKGETDITAESRRPDGTVIITDPGGALDIPKYIVEAQNGLVVRVDQEEIGTGRYDETHKGDRVVIAADEANGAGETFLYWKITIGTVQGLTGKLYDRELAFDMPDTNLVFTAYYSQPTATPCNAAVVDEVRGGSEHEIALEPGERQDLEEQLTTDADRILLDQNHANVTYKVVYTKNSAKTPETNAVKGSPEYNSDHSQAFKAAWGLNVDIERYVNGRKMPMATPSEAQFTTHIQLGKDDVDMMDYQLYRIYTDPADGSVQAELVSMSEDPEETGGLFTFTAQAGMRYVMVYSKAYRLSFINQIILPKYLYYFKVRKGEAPGDGYYDLEYGQVEEPVDYFISEEGVEYNYIDWSYREDRMREFDPHKEMNRKTYVYAYYENNQEEVDDTRKALEGAIKEAIKKTDDYFLTLKETQKLKEAIEEALNVLDRNSPKATVGELLEAIENLKEVQNPLDEVLDGRYNHYENIQSSGSKGGSKGGGGSGSGFKAQPYNPSRAKDYIVGTNGNWEKLSGTGNQWAFVLNGGIRLTKMWAKLDYANGDMSKNGWYHFNANGIMDYGWFRDEKLNWYYCNTETDGWLGKMKTGWHYDKEDGRWYYLDLETGSMAKGWKNIGGKWYYFTERNSMETYQYDSATDKWIFKGDTERPLGSMYSNESTPDGYTAGGDGAWIQ